MLAIVDARMHKRGRLIRKGLTRFLQCLVVLGALFFILSAVTSYRYGVGMTTAARGLVKQACLDGIGLGVSVYDPCTPKVARTAPDGEDRLGADYVPIQTVLTPGRPLDATGLPVTVVAVRNERIVRSPYAFRYQPFDEPRLHELRRKYGLDKIVAAAPDEMQAFVALRAWARSRFRRQDGQPLAANFDALAILDRNLHSDEPLSADRHYDPCTFFPLLFSQVVLSVGHQVRLVSAWHETADLKCHGWVEVWSNQHRKWVMMDTEYNHHFEKAGVPLNSADLMEAKNGDEPSQVRLVRGPQLPGAENPSMPHLRREQLTAADTLQWFNHHLHLLDRRNDWMTNHYFRGHPARSEEACLVYLNPWVPAPVRFEHRLRPQTSRREDFYWTLNQAEIHMRPSPPGVLQLAFRTVTPNFAHYEITQDDGAIIRSPAPEFEWKLHDGSNKLCVRSVNQFGVRGAESIVDLSVAERPGP